MWSSVEGEGISSFGKESGEVREGISRGRCSCGVAEDIYEFGSLRRGVGILVCG